MTLSLKTRAVAVSEGNSRTDCISSFQSLAWPTTNSSVTTWSDTATNTHKHWLAPSYWCRQGEDSLCLLSLTLKLDGLCSGGGDTQGTTWYGTGWISNACMLSLIKYPITYNLFKRVWSTILTQTFGAEWSSSWTMDSPKSITFSLMSR